MGKHLSLAKRRDSILDAAVEILEESGVENITMSALSARTGVSRQIVYQHFHNVDEVLEALFDRTYHTYFDHLDLGTNTYEFEEQRGLLRLEGIFELPLPMQRLVASAFFAGPHGRPFLMVIQRRLDELIDRNWVRPLVRIGYDQHAVISGVYTVVAATLECCELIEREMMTRLDAQLQIGRMVGLLLDNPRVPYSEQVD
jgi:AcrR family transcriptional regulator